MILRYYHNTIKEIPDVNNLEDFVKEKYGVDIKIKQFKPKNIFIEPYAMITEIEIDKNCLENKVREVIKEINIKLNKI